MMMMMMIIIIMIIKVIIIIQIQTLYALKTLIGFCKSTFKILHAGGNVKKRLMD